MSADRIAAVPLPSDGLMHVVGVDHFGTEIAFAIDALVLTRGCDQMSAAANLQLAKRRHLDCRDPFDASLDNEAVEHTS